MNLTDRPTPETDAATHRCDPNGEFSVVEANFARNLEQRMSALREALEKYRGQVANDGQSGYAEATLAATNPKV